MKQYRVKAVLLDFYGTLVREDHSVVENISIGISRAASVSVSDVQIFWGSVFSELCNISYAADFKLQTEIEKESLRKTVEYFKVDFDENALAERLFDYWRQPELFPETVSFLNGLDVPTCLVSNIDNRELHHALKHTGLSFTHVVTSEDCRSYKPRPEMFNRALALSGVLPHEIVHVGDSLSCDVRGAKSHRINTVWINRDNREPDGIIRPDYSCTSLKQLSEFLAV